ncbi:NADH:flavin oxidoreductase [Planctomicrobium sp. SH661]|uniref:oxidoreductase n=1 Tax=Planctomicrobium sp. SH661 TaxID=3448124 RepID=UPI003F5C0CE8
MSYPRIATLKSLTAFRERLQQLNVHLPVDEEVQTGSSAPLAQPLMSRSGTIGNRFCILPMEGWDGTAEGHPTELTRRRWRNFGASGAKLIWGGEAVAVHPEGRANPHQLLINQKTLSDFIGLRELLQQTHQERFGRTDDLLLGLQLTHSGRFARPHEHHRLEPRILYHHALLAERYGEPAVGCLMSDDEIQRLIEHFVLAARLSQRAGFRFVDIKHCHGYLGHEFLSAVDRPGRYGGSLENRTRFLREIVAGIRAEAPGLEIGVRLSLFDFLPFRPGFDGVGVPAQEPGHYRYAFGGDGTGLGIDLTETSAFLTLLEELGIELVCSTAGSPYYNPHLQRPATFPPSDGYQPPEDPLLSVARQIETTARVKALHPSLIVVGSGYSYLQDWLAHVGQAVIRREEADLIGLGRMVLSYPEMPADTLAGRPMARKLICRTFSDCTTAPRNGLVSGCYPLDPFYKQRTEREQLLKIKSDKTEAP